MTSISRRTPKPSLGDIAQRRRWGAVSLAALLACTVPWLARAQNDTEQGISPKVNHIVHEDAGSRVQELRVGGQTKRIEVQTNTPLPPYHINPHDAAQGSTNPGGQRTGAAGSAGRSTWRVLSF